MSVATFIGSSIGNGAAYAVHGAVRTAQGTGRFGADIAASAAVSYTAKTAELREQRLAIAAERQDMLVAPVRKSQRKAAVAR